MKKITLLITLFAFSFGFAQSGGNTCGAAVAIPTTVGTTNYTNTTITAFTFGGGAIGGSPASSSATWFVFQPTMGGEITVSSCGAAANTALFIGQNDMDCTVSANYSNVVSSLDDCGTASEIVSYTVFAGETYYIEWNNSQATFASQTFDWDFTFTAVTCFPPTDISIDFKTQTRVDFRFVAPVEGTPVSYDWEIVPLGNAQGVGVVASGSSSDITPSTEDVGASLVGNTDYDFRVRSNCGGGDLSDWTAPFTFKTKETAPPANDTCFTAESVSIEGNIATAASATANPSTILGACFTTANEVDQECFGGENENDDVWFTFDAPDGVTFTITVDTNLGPPNFDPTITLFDSDCDNLGAKLDCADPTAFDFAELTHTNNTGSTQTYYFRVYNFAETTPADPTFTYKLWSSATLSNDNFGQVSTFKFYPNPVENVLNIKSQNTIDSVAVYNMLGQQVMALEPNTISEEVNMSELRDGTYFVKVVSGNSVKTTKILKR